MVAPNNLSTHNTNNHTRRLIEPGGFSTILTLEKAVSKSLALAQADGHSIRHLVPKNKPRGKALKLRSRQHLPGDPVRRSPMSR